jgi:hypothetical protein
MDGSGSVALSRTELVASKDSVDHKPTRFCSVKKCKQILSPVTVEPVLLLYMLGTFTVFHFPIFALSENPPSALAPVCQQVNNISKYFQNKFFDGHE